MTTPRKEIVFIAYDNRDYESALRLYEGFMKEGIPAFLDKKSLLPGQRRKPTIHRKINETPFALVLISSHSKEPGEFWSHVSKICEKLDATPEDNISVIPVRLDNCDIPNERLSELHMVNMFPDWEDGLNKILQSIKCSLKELQKKQRPINKGELYGDVPQKPSSFIDRADVLNKVKNKILEIEESSLNDISAAKIGLCGMGGIGKTIIASVLVRDSEIRYRFPDGIFWVSIGQNPDIISRMVHLAKEIRGEKIEFVDIQDGKAMLKRILRNTVCMLVLDDVWRMEHVEALDVLENTSKILITTRNIGLITGFRGERFDIELMSREQSRSLLKLWSETKELPEQSEDILRECGDLPLAVSMVGAILRDKHHDRWNSMLNRLKEAKLEKICHGIEGCKYTNLDAVLSVSVKNLDSSLRERYLDFSVFPENMPIPIRVLQVLWLDDDVSDVDVEESLEEFVALSLLRKDGRDQFTIHELLRSYVRSLPGNDLQRRHLKLIGSYANIICKNNGLVKSKIPEINWAKGPNDGYFFENLCYHLCEAGRHKDLGIILIDFQWLNRKINKCGIHSLRRDFSYLSEDMEIMQIEKALALSSNVLSEDKCQLASQLIGRMIGKQSAKIKSLLKNASYPFCWLRPMTCSLHPPGGALLEMLEDHTESVNCVAVTTNGEKAVSASSDKTIKIWDIENGEVLQTLHEHEDEVNCVTLNPSGDLVVSASDDGTLKIWKFLTEEEPMTLPGDGKVWVNFVSVTPDGKNAISGSSDNTIKIWDLQRREVLQTLEQHKDAVNCIAISEDGKSFVSASDDGTLKIWKVLHEENPRTLSGHLGRVNTVAITSDGKQIVSGASDGLIKIWSMDSGTECRTLFGHTREVNSVISVDSNRLLSASSDKTIKMWHLPTGSVIKTLQGHSKSVNSVSLIKNKNRAISASDDKTLKIWDLSIGEEIRDMSNHSNRVCSVKISPDNRFALSLSDDGNLKLWLLSSFEEIEHRFNGGEKIICASFSNDSNQVIFATSPSDNTFGSVFNIYDIRTGKRFNLYECISKIDSFVLLPCGKKMVVAINDYRMKVFQLPDGDELSTFSGHSSLITCMAVTLDGRYAVSGSYDNTVKVWDVETGIELRTFCNHSQKVTAVGISFDNKYVISGSLDRTVIVWELESGDEIERYSNIHADRVHSVDVNWKDSYAVSSSDDKTLKLWDLNTGSVISNFYSDSEMTACKISPDGSTIIAGDNLGYVHFLRIENL